MKKEFKNIVFYTTMLLLFGSLMYYVIQQGESRHVLGGGIPDAIHSSQVVGSSFQIFTHLLVEHIKGSFGLLLLQIIVILTTCRMVGWVFNKIGQPTVIGEITVGILLGPSVLGHLAPGVSQFLFPPESLININLLSQFGLILFMYTVGMELDLKVIKEKLRESILISHVSMIIPFFLGVVMAYYIYDKYAYESTPFLPFALFIGIALSITAFPVLAHIIQDKGLTRTHLGTIALTSAATGDITAWCVLAVVVAITQAGSMDSALYNILFSVGYVLVMFLIVRPFLQVIGTLYHNKEVVTKTLITVMFLILLISSYLTEISGLHALFGAFIAGMVMPENFRFRKIITEKVEDVSLILFLPLFFASTGLRTEIGLLNTPEIWLLCLIFIIVAIFGKFGATLLAARVAGENWKNSFFLGGLMNTRGLMELVILTIGYDLKILPPSIYVILILMTLITTFMTMPLYSLINLCFRTGKKYILQRKELQKTEIFRVLLAFGRAGNGQILLDVAHQMFSLGKKKLELTTLHLAKSGSNPSQIDDYERVGFSPIIYEAQKLDLPIVQRFEVSGNIGLRIAEIANEDLYDFLLVGSGISLSNLATDVKALNSFNSLSRFLKFIFKPFFKNFEPEKVLFAPYSLVHDKTKLFIEQTHCSVGVFVDRKFIKANYIIVIINSVSDLVLLKYAKVLVRSTDGKVSILNRTNFATDESETILQKISKFVRETENSLVLPEKSLMRETFNDQDFMLISYSAWNILSKECEDALQEMPSTLIINHIPRQNVSGKQE
ncbi:MAG: cation:proton antiporter [Tannerella sp.]|jgi:Kef-type K+ transport system membrane component KefB|nr:cation:proton antiporter [Tannerella sp.]